MLARLSSLSLSLRFVRLVSIWKCVCFIRAVFSNAWSCTCRGLSWQRVRLLCRAWHPVPYHWHLSDLGDSQCEREGKLLQVAETCNNNRCFLGLMVIDAGTEAERGLYDQSDMPKTRDELHWLSFEEESEGNGFSKFQIFRFPDVNNHLVFVTSRREHSECASHVDRSRACGCET